MPAHATYSPNVSRKNAKVDAPRDDRRRTEALERASRARLMGLGFRRQVPIAGYIVDFACPAKKLIVEVDGSPAWRAAEAAADEAIERASRSSDGWTVLRFWNDDVLRDIDNVCQHIVIAAGLDRRRCQCNQLC